MPFWRLYYHTAWGTAKREPLIQAEIEASVHRVIVAKATELGPLCTPQAA